MTNENLSSTNDLQHFLKLAYIQMRKKVEHKRLTETYSIELAQMRILEELIREQIPIENTNSTTR
jgi:hypothetical protein